MFWPLPPTFIEAVMIWPVYAASSLDSSHPYLYERLSRDSEKPLGKRPGIGIDLQKVLVMGKVFRFGCLRLEGRSFGLGFQ